jgi:hypothetical protein
MVGIPNAYQYHGDLFGGQKIMSVSIWQHLGLNVSLPIEALSVQYNLTATGLSTSNYEKSMSYKWPRFCSSIMASIRLK